MKLLSNKITNIQRWTWSSGTDTTYILLHGVPDRFCSVLREATAKSKDGRIDEADFMNHAALSSRYSLFTPMEASIIFHFAGRGVGGQRLALIDFAQLLDPRWKAPSEASEVHKVAETWSGGFIHQVGESAYNFVLGGA